MAAKKPAQRGTGKPTKAKADAKNVRAASPRPAAKSSSADKNRKAPVVSTAKRARPTAAREAAGRRAKPTPLPSAARPTATRGAAGRGKPKPLPRATRSSAVSERAPAPAALVESPELLIESSKYDSRETPKRVFEEERFLFPETYEADRVRLLVKDPDWLFAHWDVSPSSWYRVRDEMGEHAVKLARLTLKVEDPANGALSVVLLPEGARSWYVRTHASHRSYRAELGLTMPSGEFRRLAASNVVVAPRVGPSDARAARRLAYARATEAEAMAAASPAPVNASTASDTRAEPGRASAPTISYIDAAASPAEASSSSLPERGGASDVFRPVGPSDPPAR